MRTETKLGALEWVSAWKREEQAVWELERTLLCLVPSPKRRRFHEVKLPVIFSPSAVAREDFAGKMVASIVGDTIAKIIERLNSLNIFGKKSTTIAENIKLHLLCIKEEPENSDAATPRWITDVTDAVIDLWDLLDDLNLPPADASVPPKQSTMATFFSLYKPTPPGLLLKLEQIENRLQRIATDSTKLPVKSSKKLTDSDVQGGEIEFVGRKEDKEGWIKRILEPTRVDNGNFPVFALVGIQGIGKTKLAEHICSDDSVRRKFGSVIWIEGIRDDEFYAESVLNRVNGGIHEFVMKKKMKLEEKENDSIVMEENLDLGEAVSEENRFLLVLDDLQNENREEWVKLQQKLVEAHGSSGGAILVTTRSYLVVDIISPKFRKNLRKLSEEDSWALFEQVVGGGPNESNIRDTQMKMVKKCCGVPLAIIKMARILRSREVKESETEYLVEEFMQEMQLMYYNELPSWHLKQCFSYLSFIFSTPYNVVDAEMLIKHWMAEGYLGPVNMYCCSSPQYPQPEDLGLDCIREFSRRSIFRDTNWCSVRYDLMRELSKYVAGKENFHIHMYNNDKTVKETIRRVELTDDFDVSNSRLKSLLSNNTNLRAVSFNMSLLDTWSLRILDEVKLSWSLCAFKSLRVLKLSELGMKMLPISIGELKSLRYLNLSRNNMKKLPNSICKLKHLQTLVLSRCHRLRELPHDLNRLRSLRHLEIEECMHLTHMPSKMKKLTNLQTLSQFVASSSQNYKSIQDFGDLISLNNLRGKLEISHLERLKFKEGEDGHAYLKDKQYLKHLILKWNHEDEEEEEDDNNKNHDQICLGHLKPHAHLQELHIVGYRGKQFSDWLWSLENLVEFNLYNCSTCESLPPLDRFPKLRILKLQRLDSLQYITDRVGDCSELGLELLKELSISDCPKLSSWWKGRTCSIAMFGSISEMIIRYCPELGCMPLYPNLDNRLVLEGSSVKPLLETINHTSASNSSLLPDSDLVSNSSPPLSKLKYLSMINVEEQSLLPEDWLKNTISLERLYISDQKSLTSRKRSEKTSLMRCFKQLSSLKNMVITNCRRLDLPDEEWEGLQSLKYLAMEEIMELKSLPEGIKHLTSLNSLSINNCPEVTTLTEVIGHLTSLEQLSISKCHKLAMLPQSMSKLSSLRWLWVDNCPLLLPRCQEETGNDWPQIKHIKHISVTATSQAYE
ncbi:putative disease resistance protein RGA1 isoform X1 [Arachis stenosperma]|uniref:putative disease resistance protein RGA1 isoform X1 n=2 Tax=Arachis stenosperma TaxID=217475 RepID=UPI0025ACB2CC|nr:putative disease resistance protein RGA1 isoform X1 [Arachis stenosperma]